MTDLSAEPEAAVSLAAKTGTPQRIKYRVTPQADSLMSAKGLGGQLEAIGALIEAVDDGDDVRVKVLVASINTDPTDGSVCFELLVCPVEGDLRKREEK